MDKPTQPGAEEARIRHMNSGHGHVFKRPDGIVTRCGGPSVCNVCCMDLAHKLLVTPIQPPKESQKIPALDKPAEGLAKVEEWQERGDAWWNVTLQKGFKFLVLKHGFKNEDIANAWANEINAIFASIVKPLREKAEKLQEEIDQQKKFAKYTHDEWLDRVNGLEKERDKNEQKFYAMAQHYDLSEAAKRETEKDRDAWKERYRLAMEDCERERLRLAACGVAAMQNTEKTRAERITPDNPYWSASYGDVCRSVDDEMKYRFDADRLAETLKEIKDRGCSCSHDPHEALCESCVAGSALAAHEALKGKT